MTRERKMAMTFTPVEDDGAIETEKATDAADLPHHYHGGLEQKCATCGRTAQAELHQRAAREVAHDRGGAILERELGS